MSVREEAARGFQQGADAYERGRPGYPRGAVQWLWTELGLEPGRTVLDVAAGTGKLTRELVPSGATVIAVEPVPAMRAVLERVVPDARALDGTAEALPIDDATVDAITVASAFHWFDGPVGGGRVPPCAAAGGQGRAAVESPPARPADPPGGR